MQFDEKKAKEIIAKFELSHKTLRVWKTRGNIPNKYVHIDGTLAKTTYLKSIDKHQSNKLRLLFSTGKLNHTALSSINNIQIADFLRNKGNISVVQYDSLKKEVTQLSNLLRQLTQHTNYDKILRAARNVKKETRLHWYLIFSSTTLDLLQKGYEPSIEQLEQMKIDAELFRQTLIL